VKLYRRITNVVPSIVFGTLALIVFFTIVDSNFISSRNLFNMLNNASILTVVAMGMTLAILSAQIDLSMGSVMSLSAIVTGIIIQSTAELTVMFMIFGIVCGLCMGVFFGLFNGIMIGKFKFDYWLITFASMSIARSLALVISNGNIISGYPRMYRNLGDYRILNMIPSSVVFTVIICAVVIWVSTRTRLGYSIYAVGDSDEVAQKSGINVPKVRLKVYIISGILASLGGILLASRTNSASATLGLNYEFNAIAAVVIGGTPFEGGNGGLLGTVLGSILIAVMRSGLQFVGLTPHWQTLLVGVFIMLIIIFDVTSSKLRHKREQRRFYRD